jgi:hypothetical protein
MDPFTQKECLPAGRTGANRGNDDMLKEPDWLEKSLKRSLME